MDTIDPNRRAFLFGTRSLPEAERDVASAESGATAVEYGLIGALIAVAIIPGLTIMATRMRQNYACATRVHTGAKQPTFCARKGAS